MFKGYQGRAGLLAVVYTVWQNSRRVCIGLFREYGIMVMMALGCLETDTEGQSSRRVVLSRVYPDSLLETETLDGRTRGTNETSMRLRRAKA
jgi:hypothetical protein